MFLGEVDHRCVLRVLCHAHDPIKPESGKQPCGEDSREKDSRINPLGSIDMGNGKEDSVPCKAIERNGKGRRAESQGAQPSMGGSVQMTEQNKASESNP